MALTTDLGANLRFMWGKKLPNTFSQVKIVSEVGSKRSTGHG